MEDHFRDVDLILKKLQSSGITRKLQKGEWLMDKVTYMGHLIKPGQLEMDDVSNAVICKPPHCKHRSNCTSFWGYVTCIDDWSCVTRIIPHP